MLFIFIFLFIPGDYSSIEFHIFKKNILEYSGAFVRKSEFEIFPPLYFYLKEFQFFKTNKSRPVPYQIKFEWDIGFKKGRDNLIIRAVYSHVCNHGIDHPGTDRRQWNQFAIKTDFLNKNMYIKNSVGYVVSPFGPKRKNNFYNLILLHEFIFEKKLKLFCLSLNLKFEEFFESSSIKYSCFIKAFIIKNFYLGGGAWREHGLSGKNEEMINIYEIFTGIFEKIPDFKISYGYLFKNPTYSFFSDFFVKYKILKNLKIITHLKTISPPKTQQPRFYDYKGGIEIDLKKINLTLYHRERRDGNLFDGDIEEFNSLNSKFHLFSIEYFFLKRKFPFNFSFGIKDYKSIYRWKTFPFEVKFMIEISYLIGKNRKGLVFEAGPFFKINAKRKIGLCFSQKIASPYTLERYGIFEHRFFISVEK